MTSVTQGEKLLAMLACGKTTRQAASSSISCDASGGGNRQTRRKQRRIQTGEGEMGADLKLLGPLL